MHGEPGPHPRSRHLCDFEAALHDHHVLPPAACRQQLHLRVAAPLLKQLARSRWGQWGQWPFPKLLQLWIYFPSIFLTLASSPPASWPEAKVKLGRCGVWEGGCREGRCGGGSPHPHNRHSPCPHGCTRCSSPPEPSCSGWLVGRGKGCNTWERPHQ
jgi:hypothetical protein